MPSTATTLKRHNHRVHPCKPEQKQELLNVLLQKNSDKTILVVTSNGAIDHVNDFKNVTIVSDEDLEKSSDLTCELMISYNLPQKAILYMARIARSSEFAIILLDSEEQSLLYPIETLLGRTIMQETIQGFETIIQKAEPLKKEYKPRDDKREYKPRSTDFKGEKREFKPRDDKKEYKPRDDKKEYKPKSADFQGEKREFKPRDDKKEYKPRDDKKEYKPRSADFQGEKKEYKPRSTEERNDKKYADKRDDKRPAKKPYNKDADKSKSWDKKETKGSKFLGKDEKGKALFSGKTGERNHRHDGTPKDFVPKVPGRKINIKSLNKAEDSK